MPALQAAPNPTFIKAGHFIDVLQGQVLEKVIIQVEDQHIKAVGSDVSVPAGATVFDLLDGWVLPGLIDCHEGAWNLSGSDRLRRLFGRGTCRRMETP